ncbi:adenylosuccinate lyase, partial [Streptococcus anginosus]|nr:adenylosuccinate lyase [Streptococcus anginosus]
QPLTAQAWDEQRDFRDLVEANEEITDLLSPEEIDDAFDYHYHLQRVDEIFERLGI